MNYIDNNLRCTTGKLWYFSWKTIKIVRNNFLILFYFSSSRLKVKLTITFLKKVCIIKNFDKHIHEWIYYWKLKKYIMNAVINVYTATSKNNPAILLFLRYCGCISLLIVIILSTLTPNPNQIWKKITLRIILWSENYF